MTTQAWNRRNLKGFTIPLGFCTMKHGFAHWKLVRKLCAKTTCKEETPHSFPTVTYLPIVQVTHWEASSTPCPHVFIKDPLPRGCRVLLQSFAIADDLNCSWCSVDVRAQNHVRAFKIPSTSCVPLCVLLYSIAFTHKLNACPTWKHLSKFTVQNSPWMLCPSCFSVLSLFSQLWRPRPPPLLRPPFPPLPSVLWGQLIVDWNLRIQSTTKGWYCWNTDNSYMSNSWKKKGLSKRHLMNTIEI